MNHPIFAAIKSKDNIQFDRLIKKVDINMKDPWKESLIWIAMLWHNFYAVDKILEYGGDINQPDNMGTDTPLKYAVRDKNIELLKILEKYEIERKSKDTLSLGKMKSLLSEKE